MPYLQMFGSIESSSRYMKLKSNIRNTQINITSIHVLHDFSSKIKYMEHIKSSIYHKYNWFTILMPILEVVKCRNLYSVDAYMLPPFCSQTTSFDAFGLTVNACNTCQQHGRQFTPKCTLIMQLNSNAVQWLAFEENFVMY